MQRLAPIHRPFFAWPGWRHLLRAVASTMLCAALFAAVYAGTDWLTHRRSTRIRVHLDFETDIPFVPAMTLVYLSIYPLFWMAPFVLRRRSELRALAIVIGITIVIGGIGFALIPAELAFNTSSPTGLWGPLFQFADSMNGRYNLAPSLHVAFSTLCVAVYSRSESVPLTTGLWMWCMLIAASTVLIHQHHLLDVATGFAIGIIMGRLVYPRLVLCAHAKASGWT